MVLLQMLGLGVQLLATVVHMLSIFLTMVVLLMNIMVIMPLWYMLPNYSALLMVNMNSHMTGMPMEKVIMTISGLL